MPFPTGTIGAHDDATHQGSAKRNTAGGVASLDANGDVNAVGCRVCLAKDATEYIYIRELATLQDAIALNRTGANTFEAYLNVSAVWQILQHAGMKDVASGIAGLDANTQLDISQLRPSLEEYSNHLGATDNFTETAVSGNGTAAADATNHEMDLSTGLTLAGYAYFRAKPTITLGTKPIVINIIGNNLAEGVGGIRYGILGLEQDHTSFAVPSRRCAAFVMWSDAAWKAVTSPGAGSGEQTTAVPFVSGDLLTIVATTAKVMYFRNGVLVATHTSGIPTGTMYFGCSVYSEAGVTTAKTLSTDFMSLKKYV